MVLDSTYLTSLRGVGNARGLEELNVRYNMISGPMPQDLSRLVNLRSLDISDNQLTGEIPFWLSSLPRLQTFKAGNNKLSGRMFDFADNTQLEYIDLSNNDLSGPVPLTLLQRAPKDDKIVVDAANNALTGTVPAQLASFAELSVHLTGNKISALGRGLCGASGWNNEDVASYGCDGIMCAPGFANQAGRQTADDNPCVPCKAAKFMGSTSCKGGAASSAYRLFRVAGLLLGVAATAVLSFL